MDTKKYRTFLEPGDRNDRLVCIDCKRGHIYQWGPGEIACSLDISSKKTRDRLAELGFELVQDGDDGQTWVGPMKCLGSACRAMGARTKRKGPSREELIKRGFINE